MTIRPRGKPGFSKLREAAAAFVEDMAYVRETLARADRTTPGELRRLSAILRRLLIENDCGRCSARRLPFPDNDAIYKAARSRACAY